MASQARAVVAAVVELRGLSEIRPVDMKVVDDKTFGEIFAAKANKELRPKDRVRGLRFPSEIYLGFYDEFSKTVVLRDHMPKWAADAGVDPLDMLAHEVEHALQDQHFGIPEMSSIGDDDRLVATKSLYEGDAQLVMVAYHAKRLHQSWRHAALYAYREGDISSDILIRAGLFSPSLLAMPLPMREATTFPYLNGLAFASTLYRAGGFALVDRAFSHPPQSTAQILEPSRYLEGVRPVDFRRLPLPPGVRVGAMTTLGALALRSLPSVLLAPQAPGQATRAPVQGWNGDRFAELEAQGGLPGLALSVEWSSNDQARRFEAAVRRALDSKGSAAKREPDAWAVACDGTSFALVHMAHAAAIAQALLHVADPPRPADPPLGPVVVPPPPVPLTERPDVRGVLVNSVFESRWLSVRATIPPGFAADASKPETQLLIVRRTPTMAVATFSALATEMTPQTRTQLHKTFIEGMVGALRGASRPLEVSLGTSATPLGVGSQVTWRFAVNGVRMTARSVLVDLCGGIAALQWGSLWMDDGNDARTLESWPQTFEWTSEGMPPACDDIRRENAEDAP